MRHDCGVVRDYILVVIGWSLSRQHHAGLAGQHGVAVVEAYRPLQLHCIANVLVQKACRQAFVSVLLARRIPRW